MPGRLKKKTPFRLTWLIRPKNWGCLESASLKNTAGSDATNLSTKAVKKGDKWILNGLKHFITNGPIADVYTVFAVTDKEKGAKGGITAFLVERNFPGLIVGKTDKKMGLRGSYTSQIIFEECEVPEENVIGEVGQGYSSALKILGEGRVGLPYRSMEG